MSCFYFILQQFFIKEICSILQGNFCNASLVKNAWCEVNSTFGIDSSKNNAWLQQIFSGKVIFKAAPFSLHFAMAFHQRNLFHFAGVTSAMFFSASLVKNAWCEVSSTFGIDSSNDHTWSRWIFSGKAIFKAVPFLLHFAAVFHQRNPLDFAG